MENNDDMIEQLILSGALEVAGFDSESEEMTYSFTDKLKDISPDLHNLFENFFYQELLFLWQNGFINVDLFSEIPSVSLSTKSFDEEEVRKLEKDKQHSLKEIMRILLQ